MSVEKVMSRLLLAGVGVLNMRDALFIQARDERSQHNLQYLPSALFPCQIERLTARTDEHFAKHVGEYLS